MLIVCVPLGVGCGCVFSLRGFRFLCLCVYCEKMVGLGGGVGGGRGSRVGWRGGNDCKQHGHGVGSCPVGWREVVCVCLGRFVYAHCVGGWRLVCGVSCLACGWAVDYYWGVGAGEPLYVGGGGGGVVKSEVRVGGRGGAICWGG